jgi:predicted phosphodiesterase
MRIFTISDIHADYKENDLWIKSLSNHDYKHDCLIIAGDISDSLSLIARCFELLTRKFHSVFYVPGNHDLWVRNHSQNSSFGKFYELLELARDFGVITQEESFGTTIIIPMFSWYDLSFGEMSETLTERWMDFYHCKWPENYDTPSAQNHFFLQKNNIEKKPASHTVITFSHFLPRIDVMPHYIPKKFRHVYPVLGSPLLDLQIRALHSKIHVYGHSHVNRIAKIEGIQYINNAFGYPSERRITAKNLLKIAEI